MSTVPMFAPDGSLKLVPNQMADAASKAGGQPAVAIIAPDGSRKYAPQSQVRQLLSLGAKLAPVDQGQSTTKIAQDISGIHPFNNPIAQGVAGPARAVWGLLKTPYNVAQSAFSPGQTPEEIAAEANGPTALFAEREIVQPARKAAVQAQQYWTSGHPILAGLSALGAIPFLGPMGQAAGERMAAGDVPGAITESATNALMMGAPKSITAGVKRIVSPALRRGGEIIGGTGTGATKALVEKTAANNAAETASAAAKQVAQDAKRAKELKTFHEKTRTEPETSLESGRPRTAEELGSHKEALERGLERLDTEFQSDLKETQARVKEQADTKYAEVRAATEGHTVPSSDLAGAVKTAEGKLQGSSESIKVFKDILSKHPESAPDFVKYQGASIPKGHPLYDVLTQGEKAPGATFADLQGYYSELGEKLSSGSLPGDVYQATKSLHDSIGEMMNRVATEAGVGPKLADAQQFYRGYMQTFRDHSSPIYKAINATERGKATAALAGKDQTGIEALARYDPQLARRANTLRDYHAEAKAIPRPKTETAKTPPKLAPKPEPVNPNLKKIGTEDIRGAKAAALAKRAQTIQHYAYRAAMYVTTYRALAAVGRAAMGNPGALAAVPADIGEGIAVAGGGHLVAKLLENPRVAKLLTEPTPADVAAIPPEMRGDLAGIVQVAQRQGIKVSPALVGLPSPGSNFSYVKDPMYSQGYTLVRVDPAKLDAAWKNDPDYVGSAGQGGMVNRYAGFQNWIKTNPGKPIEAPAVDLVGKGKVTFSNGRHRFAYLRDAGEKSVAIAVRDRDATQVAKQFGP